MKIKYFLTISFSLSFFYILLFGFLVKDKNDIGEGFGQSSTKIEKNVCPIGITNLEESTNKDLEIKANNCQKEIFRFLKNSSKQNMLFLSNSQLGAINQRIGNDKSYVSIISEETNKKELPIYISGLWIENINLMEISSVYSDFAKCGIKIDTLVFPAFLDDTRNSEIRETLKNYDKFICPEKYENKKENDKLIIDNGNLIKITKKIKNNFLVFNYLQNLNDNFRGKLYLLRNTIFNIKPTSVRKISRVRLNQNLKALEDILNQRKLESSETILYIPPLLYSQRSEIIPYQKEEYSNFKLSVKNKCLAKDKCFFYNLEESVPNEYWGSKKSITLRDGKNSNLDFMHFNGFGHKIFSKVLSKIIFEDKS